MSLPTKVLQMRTELQSIDLKLLQLIEKRIKKSVKIQSLKQKLHLPLVDSNQERATINQIEKDSTLDSKQIASIFHTIIQLSKQEFSKQKNK